MNSIFPSEVTPTACPFNPITSVSFVFELDANHSYFQVPESTNILSSNCPSLFRIAKGPPALKLDPIRLIVGSANDWETKGLC